jgi:cobalt-zinc-cadmium efflux system protein
VDVAKIREVLSTFAGVVSVHDLHVWSVGAGEVALSGHVIVQPDHAHPQIVREMGKVLREKFAISHSTIQLEHSGCEQVGLHP